MMEKQSYKNRIYIVFFAIAILSVSIAVRMFSIQLAEAPEWKEKAENYVTEYRDIEAVRGNILAEDGSLLATSLPIYEIRMDLAADGLSDDLFFNDVDSLAWYLANLFKDRENPKSKTDYKNSLRKAKAEKKRYHLIERGVDYNEVQIAKTFPIFKKGRFKGGVLFEKQNKRMYPFKQLAKRTIGYDKVGVSPVGIEGAYSKELRGVDGKRLERRLTGGQWMPLSDKNDVEPEDGLDIVTSIDINVQDVAERALLRTLEKNGAHHGSVVLMEVETGMVKAIANLTDNGEGNYIEAFNYAVGEATEPGSTFKLPALMAALEEGVVDLDDEVDTGKGVTHFYGEKMEDSKKGGYGKISVQRAFEVSSNVGISKIITEHFGKNPQRFIDRLFAMGVGYRTAVEIKGEPDPLIKSTDDRTWSGLTLPWTSIGYECLMTPLQTLTFYNAVANDGEMVRPQFVAQMRKQNEVVFDAQPQVINSSIASKSTIEKAQKMMLGVVQNEGTAKNLKNDEFLIAGKTGTAQIVNKEHGGYGPEGGHSYQASFVGYFPADNPQYSCIVVVSAPSKSVYYGNLVAGPVFEEIANKVYAKRFDLQHEEPAVEEGMFATNLPVSKHGAQDDLNLVFSEFGVEVDSQSPDAEWVVTRTGKQTVQTEIRKIEQDKVPNVKGMGLIDAIYLLENHGLQVETKGYGLIKEQSIPPGSLISEHNTITLELSL